MPYKITLNDAHKRFTADQDKIFPPQETVKRFHDKLKKIDLDILKKHDPHRYRSPGHPGLFQHLRSRCRGCHRYQKTNGKRRHS